MYKNFGSNLLKTMTEAMGSYGLYIDIDKRCNDELLISLEEKEKLKEGYFNENLGHTTILLSREIKDRLRSNTLFFNVLDTAIYEISNILNRENDKMKYIIEVNIEEDYEFIQWRDTVITIKIPIKDTKYIIQLWKVLSENVRKKIKSIDADIEEIKKISHNLSIFIEILE